jgi:hypothetical protein
MSSEGHASANPEALDVFVKGDLSAALLILLARGPMFASNDERASGDALGWYHADFLSPRIASAAHTARIKPYAKTKKVGWFQASFYPNDIDLIRACLAFPCAKSRMGAQSTRDRDKIEESVEPARLHLGSSSRN